MRRYFIHVVTGGERLIDREGAYFADLPAAIAEARQSALDLAAEELRSGRLFPRAWRTQVVDENDTVCATVHFNDLLDGYQVPKPNDHSAVVEAVQSVARSADKNCEEVRNAMAEAWLQLSKLRALSAKLPAG